jgi:hypothetical protein
MRIACLMSLARKMAGAISQTGWSWKLPVAKVRIQVRTHSIRTAMPSPPCSCCHQSMSVWRLKPKPSRSFTVPVCHFIRCAHRLRRSVIASV